MSCVLMIFISAKSVHHPEYFIELTSRAKATRYSSASSSISIHGADKNRSVGRSSIWSKSRPTIIGSPIPARKDLLNCGLIDD